MSRVYKEISENSLELIWTETDELGNKASGSVNRDSMEVQSFLSTGGEIEIYSAPVEE
jgi:hypothetical protein